MTEKKQKFISMGDLAVLLGIKKSKLWHYNKLGLIKPITTVGRMFIYDENETRMLVKKIEQFKKSGKNLTEINEIINK